MSDEIASAHPPRGLKTAGIVSAVILAGIVAIGTISRASDAHEAQHWSDARAVPVVHLVQVGASEVRLMISPCRAPWLPGTRSTALRAGRRLCLKGLVPRHRRPGRHRHAAWADRYARAGPADRAGTRGSGKRAVPTLRSPAAPLHAANDLLTTNSVSHGRKPTRKMAMPRRSRRRWKLAEANLGRLLALKQFATIRAPFAGVVTARSAEIGDLVGAWLHDPAALVRGRRCPSHPHLCRRSAEPFGGHAAWAECDADGARLSQSTVRCRGDRDGGKTLSTARRAHCRFSLLPTIRPVRSNLAAMPRSASRYRARRIPSRFHRAL